MGHFSSRDDWGQTPILIRLKRKRRIEDVESMAQLLYEHRYENPRMNARKLFREGMGSYELEHILASTKGGGVGSLEYTRGFKKTKTGRRR